MSYITKLESCLLQRLGLHQFVHFSVDMDPPPEPHPFDTKHEAKLFVAEKSIREKKPFKVVRSDARRFEIVCPVEGCAYKLNIRARKDDKFYVTKKGRGHTCRSVSPTIKKVWLRSKIAEMIAESETITTPQLSDCFRLRFGLDVKLHILEKCYRQAKKRYPFNKRVFWDSSVVP